MTILDMLGQSGVLTLLGMGVVFSFLIIMVITISLAGKIIRSAEPDMAVKAVAPAAVKPAANNDAVTAAIVAAVNQYRKNN